MRFRTAHWIDVVEVVFLVVLFVTSEAQAYHQILHETYTVKVVSERDRSDMDFARARKHHGVLVFYWHEQRHEWVFDRAGKTCSAFAFIDKKKKGVHSTPTTDHLMYSRSKHS
jgi:hypothetical protein